MFKFCSAPFDTISIHENGGIASCLCQGWHTQGPNMGNLNQNTLTEIFANQNFDNFRSSIVDQTFRYCRKDECSKLWNLDQVESLDQVAKPKRLPTTMNLLIEKNCNLKCGSCRTGIIWDKAVNPQVEHILNTLVNDYQDFQEPVWFQCDGFGDIFASAAYKNFLRRDDLPKCFQFNLTTNGNLITKNLDIIEKLAPQLFSVCVSFDAANADTYKDVRGGKFELIIEGVNVMKRMGVLRVNASFVVQKKNYLEVLDYYNLCKELGINYAGISKIDRWGHMSDEWWQANQIDNNSEVDYNFLIPALKTIKQDPKFGLCGGLENLIATKSTSISN
jgi:hypothetical protein